MPRTQTAWAGALAGSLSAGAALGASELLSGLSRQAPSLVIAVADIVVDETPGGVVRWSIGTLGASQKTLLIAGVVVCSLLIGALLGVLSRRRLVVGALGFTLFGLIGGWAGTDQGRTSDAGAWASAVFSVVVGVVVLAVLLGRGRPGRAPGHAPDRRWFLVGSGATALFAVVSAGLGSRLRQSLAAEAARADLAAELGPPSVTVPAGVETLDHVTQGISPLITSNRDFYRIDTALLVPQVDPDNWSLRITGMVDRELELSFDDLLAMDTIEEFVTLACVSNEVGGDLVGNALWSGVPLGELLDRAGVDPKATQVVGRSVDGWTAGFPTEVAFDGRPAMVAITMNGEPLPVRHGFPARLVVPGLYGYVSATKWLAEIELTTWEAFNGYWIPRGWSKEGPIKTQSRIDAPRRGSSIAAGRTAVAGVAWAPTRSIERVEVRIDGGRWERARLSGALSENTWVQWVYEWDATPGRHRLEVRATEGTGEAQTAEHSPPAPSGATGHHTIEVDVERPA